MSEECFQLKGSLIPQTVLELYHYSPDIFAQHLAEKVKQAPLFFQQTPVIVSLEKLKNSETVIDFQELRNLCQEFGLIPIAVKGGSDILAEAAEACGFATMPAALPKMEKNAKLEKSVKRDLFPNSRLVETNPANNLENSLDKKGNPQSQIKNVSRESNDTPHAKQPAHLEDSAKKSAVKPEKVAEKPAENESTEKMPVVRPSKLVTTPVRSGQQIYAKDSDLVVVSQVSPGAEVIADGNIHIYGPLRGRALAGVKGDLNVRIFCRSLEAELVSIAGQYMLNEDLRNHHWGEPVQVFIKDGVLHIDPL